MPFLAPVFAAISSFAASSFLAGFVVNLGASLLLTTAAAALTRNPRLLRAFGARPIGADR